MKAIFTYPNNAGTSYIDPLYVGSAADGFQKRIKDLKDGNYKAWDGTAPTDTVSELMSNISKFSENYYDNTSTGYPWKVGDVNITINDMYTYPLLTGSVTTQQHNDITATVIWSDILGHFYAANHGLTQGQIITTSAFDGDFSVVNGNQYYVQYTDANIFRLSVDAGLTQIVSLYDLKEATVVSSNEYVLGTASPHNMSNGMPVTLSGLNGSWSVFNGLDVYAKVDSSQGLKFTTDAAGTTEYRVVDLGKSTVTDATITQPSVFTGANNLVDGMSVNLSLFDGAMTEYNGTMGTVDGATSTTFNLRDAAGDLIGFNTDEHVGNGNDTTGSIQSVIIPDSMTSPMILSYPQLPQASSLARWEQGNYNAGPYDARYTNTNVRPYYLHPVTPTSKTYYVSSVDSTDPADYHTLEDWLTDVSTYPEFARKCDTFAMNINHGQNTVEITDWANTDGKQQPNDGPRPLTFEDNPTFLLSSGDGIVARDILYAELESGDNYRIYTDQAKTNLVSDWSDYLMTMDGRYDPTYLKSYNKNTPILDDSGLHNLATYAYRGYFTGTPNGSFIGNKQWDGGDISDQTITDSGLTLNGDVLYAYDNSDPSAAESDYTFVSQSVYINGGSTGRYGFYCEDTSEGGTLFQDILATTPNPTGEQNTLSTIYTDHGYMQFRYHDAVEGRYYFQLYSDEEMSDIPAQFGPFWLKTNGQLLTYEFSEDLPTEDITNFVWPINETLDGIAVGFRVPDNYNFTFDASFKIEAPNANENKVEFKDNYLINGNPYTNTIILPVSVSAIDATFVANPLYAKLKAGMRVIYNSKSYVVSGGHIASNNMVYVDGATDARTGMGNTMFKNFYLHDITDDRTSDFLVDYTQTIDFQYADDVNGSQYSPYDMESEYIVKDWQATLIPNVPFVVSNTPLLRYSDSGDISRIGAVDNGRLISPTLDLHTVLYSNDSITTGYVEEDFTSQGPWDQSTLNFISSTTGNILEIDATPAWVYASVNPVVATAGQAFLDSPDTYSLTSIDLTIPGNTQYQYLTSTGLEPGAEIDSLVYRNTNGKTKFTYYPSAPDITLTTDANGRLTGATLNSPLIGFDEPKDIAMDIFSLPDTYTPPALSPAAQEDVFDTADQWTTNGYNGAKEFGKYIIPTTAEITYNTPSTTNMSQNGKKYVRSAGFTRWKLSVSYTNLTKAEFQILQADAQAARGQATPFFLVTSQWGNKVLDFENIKSTTAPRLIEPYTAGETIMKFGGFESNESEVFKKGQIIRTNSDNGSLSTVLNTVDANVYGEAEVRIAFALGANKTNGQRIATDNYHYVVTLDSDEFTYSVDTYGLFNVNVGFELGEWG